MRAFAWLMGLFRAAIRLLMTDRVHVSVVGKFVRGVILVPVFGVMFMLLLLRALVLGPMRTEATSADGDRYACHLPDLIQTYIYLFGAWEPDLAAFMRSRLQAGDVFVDVGANVGYDTMLAARPVGDAGRVVAIEAAPAVFDRLLETLRLNGSPTNIRTINKAAAASRGTLAVYAGPQHNIGLTTTVRRGNMPRVSEVEAMPLGDLLLPDELVRVRIIKIDVEGGEDAVLEGMLDCVQRLPQHVEIAVELSPAWWADRTHSAADVLRPYVECGFNVYTIANNYWPWRLLWPRDVQRPRRLRDDMALTRPMKRLDIVLSRLDADHL